MLTAAVIAALAAGAPRADASFCERMAHVWKMGQTRTDGRRTDWARLKGPYQHAISYAYTGDAREYQGPARDEICYTDDRAGTCDVFGPGVLEIRTPGSARRFTAKPGERARFDTNGRVINCTDLPAEASDAPR